MKRILSFLAVSFLCISALCPGVLAQELLIPVGQVIGLELSNDTVTVVAFEDPTGGTARTAGLEIGDTLVSVDGHPITCAEDVRTGLRGCGEEVELTIRRQGQERRLRLRPQRSDGQARLGVYLRQGVTGIGTITYYDPESGRFGTLGHGVSDTDGALLDMRWGSAYRAQIVSVKKGQVGKPGQLKGSADAMEVVGTLNKNTAQGVFGTSKQGWQGQPLPVADFEDVQTGDAVILSTIAGCEPQEYSVEILKIYAEDRADHRNFLLRVTDPDLLAATGGIVQGMSGSPIIQNGKLIGAVTHV